MGSVSKRRKARIASPFDVEHPGDLPHRVKAGSCRIDMHDDDVVLYVDVGGDTAALHISSPQFQNLVARRIVLLDT